MTECLFILADYTVWSMMVMMMITIITFISLNSVV